MSATKQSAEQAVLTALSRRSELTSAEIAEATKRGKSTVGKVLGRLEHSRKVKRAKGERSGASRQPDRWNATTKRQASQRTERARERLRPGELDGLALDYLRKHGRDGPLGPTAVANGLGRSSGAVANCLARLAERKQVHQTSVRPRRYTAK